MRAKYSPTISERYLDRHWWFRNGGGYGLLDDGRSMTERYQHFDHEGFDQFGYNPAGRDRAGYSVRDYESSEELYSTVSGERGFRGGKSVSDYWTAVSEVIALFGERFPDLECTLPQEQPSGGPGISIFVTRNGGYGVVLRLSDVDGLARTIEVRFDDGTGGSSPSDPDWSVNVIVNTCGETSRAALCLIETMDAAIAFAAAEIADYDPDRFIHDIRLMEGGDGVAFLTAAPHGIQASGDLMGSVYAVDAVSAIEKLASRFVAGGPIHRMAARGIARLSREASEDLVAVRSHSRISETPSLPKPRPMSI